MTIELTTITLHHPTTDEYDEFLKPDQLEEDLDHLPVSISSLTTFGAWNLYLSHALSTWNGRTYEFGAVSYFFLLFLDPDSFPFPSPFPDRQTGRRTDGRPSLHTTIIICQTRRMLFYLFSNAAVGYHRPYSRLLPFHIPYLPNRCGTPAPAPLPKFQFPMAQLFDNKKQGQCIRRWEVLLTI